VRALAGEKTGFAYSDEIVLPALEEASRAARAIALKGGDRSVQAWSAKAGHELYLPADPASALVDHEKVSWLERVDRETATPGSAHRAGDGEHRGGARGRAHRHERWRSRRRHPSAGGVSMSQSSSSRTGGASRAMPGAGGRFSLGGTRQRRPGRCARPRGCTPGARQSRRGAGACRAQRRVVLGPGWPEVLLHEAIGHGLEGDFNRKGTSAFANRIG